MLTIYGLKNCDTCRKARRWLDERGQDYRFHDVRGDGLGKEAIAGWIDAVGVDVLLNRRGTTWRGLSDAEKGVADAAGAAALMAAYPALVKRPVFEIAGRLVVGFGDAERSKLEALVA